MRLRRRPGHGSGRRLRPAWRARVIVLHVGDEVSVDAAPISTARTSMTFRVEAWCRSRDGDEQIKVTEAAFTSVVIDSGSHPRPMLLG